MIGNPGELFLKPPVACLFRNLIAVLNRSKNRPYFSVAIATLPEVNKFNGISAFR